MMQDEQAGTALPEGLRETVAAAHADGVGDVDALKAKLEAAGAKLEAAGARDVVALTGEWAIDTTALVAHLRARVPTLVPTMLLHHTGFTPEEAAAVWATLTDEERARVVLHDDKGVVLFPEARREPRGPQRAADHHIPERSPRP